MSYPQHERLQEVKDESQGLGLFLNWFLSQYRVFEQDVDPMDCHGCGHQLDCEFCGATAEEPRARRYTGDLFIQRVLADYFDVDYDELMNEKQRMYESLPAMLEQRMES